MLTRTPWSELQQHWWVARLAGCPQPPQFHAEGDVATHTRMVLEALESDPVFGRLSPADQTLVWNAAMFHDVAKPDCTREGPHGLTSRGHSRRGALLTREILWRSNSEPAEREAVAALVGYHMAPFFLLEQTDPRHRLLCMSLAVRCDLLALLARCDARGRIAPDQGRLLEAVELFEQLAQEEGVWQQPRLFPSEASRVHYVRVGGDPDREVFFQPRCRVTVTSGLPGSGKDTWLGRHAPELPQVSLDAWRQQLGVDPRDEQSRVIEAAREQARGFLRAGQDFAWNATNLSRELRARCLQLFHDYGAEIRLVHTETGCVELLRRNRERAASLPEAALEGLIKRWEFPHPGEAHQLVWAAS